MIFEAKIELKQYLSSINPIYAKYTEGLWASEVNSISQLGDASLTVLQACGVENPAHAGNIIARSKAPGKWSCSHCSVTLVHCPASERCCAAASCFRANLSSVASTLICAHALLQLVLQSRCPNSGPVCAFYNRSACRSQQVQRSLLSTLMYSSINRPIQTGVETNFTMVRQRSSCSKVSKLSRPFTTLILITSLLA